MIFIFIIGMILFGVGIRLAAGVLFFYLGVRRDLYFQPERAWIGMARLGGVLLMLGSFMIGMALLGGLLSGLLIVLGGTLLLSVWWAFSPAVLNLAPPGWVRRLESGRNSAELDAIIQNGIAMQHLYPDTFRRVIRDEAGWEIWLTTITGRIPLVSLDLYVIRAKQAMEHHLYPIAIAAAENIISYRPDQALGYMLRGQAYFRNHQYKLALQDYSRAIYLQPHEAENYYQRARLFIILEQPSIALTDLDQALALQPGRENWQHLRQFVQQMVFRQTVNESG